MRSIFLPESRHEIDPPDVKLPFEALIAQFFSAADRKLAEGVLNKIEEHYPEGFLGTLMCLENSLWMERGGAEKNSDENLTRTYIDKKEYLIEVISIAKQRVMGGTAIALSAS